jgi:hypothetical protein
LKDRGLFFAACTFSKIRKIADDTTSTKLTGRDPVRAPVTRWTIDKGAADPDYQLAIKGPSRSAAPRGLALHAGLEAPDKPDGISWIIHRPRSLTARSRR